MCMSILPACTPCAQSWKSSEGTGFPRTECIVGCEPSYGCYELYLSCL